MAWKVLTADKKGTRSFQKEKHNSESFKKALSDCKNIMATFATFVHGDNLNIIMPLADLDLFDFLKDDKPHIGREAQHCSPLNLFKQMHDLASALNFLHEELYTDRQVSCAHMDLKPENILISWDDEEKFPVGIWRISDFGLSVIRELPTEQNKGLVTTGDMIRETSSMPPPRDLGPYQPPEMQQNPALKSTVSKTSDLWSFGAMLAMVFSFAIGGVQETAELFRRRSGNYEDDYFWAKDESESNEAAQYYVKKEVLEWLSDQRPKLEAPKPQEWIDPCISLIHGLLRIPKRERTSAKACRTALSNICQKANDQKANGQLLSLASSLSLEGSPRIEPRRVQLERVQRPSERRNEIELLTEAQSDIIKRHSTDESRRNRWPSGNLSPTNMAVEPLPIHERRYSIQWSRALEKPQFVRLKIPEKCFRSFLSSKSDLVAFIGPFEVFIHRVDWLSAAAIWSENISTARESFDNVSKPRKFAVAEGRQWTSALIAGDFLALLSKSNNPRITQVRLPSIANAYQMMTRAQMYAEVYQNFMSSGDKLNIRPRRIDLPDEYRDIRLSSKGAFLTMFADHLIINTPG